LVKKETISSEVDKITAEFGIKSVDKVILDHPEGVPVFKVIKDYLMSQDPNGDHGYLDNYIDIVAVGNCGLRFNPQADEQTYIGSTAAACLRAKKMNTLFIPA
jgi:hypothetical protein